MCRPCAKLAYRSAQRWLSQQPSNTPIEKKRAGEWVTAQVASRIPASIHAQTRQTTSATYHVQKKKEGGQEHPKETLKVDTKTAPKKLRYPLPHHTYVHTRPAEWTASDIPPRNCPAQLDVDGGERAGTTGGAGVDSARAAAALPAVRATTSG